MEDHTSFLFNFLIVQLFLDPQFRVPDPFSLPFFLSFSSILSFFSIIALRCNIFRGFFSSTCSCSISHQYLIGSPIRTAVCSSKWKKLVNFKQAIPPCHQLPAAEKNPLCGLPIGGEILLETVRRWRLNIFFSISGIKSIFGQRMFIRIHIFMNTSKKCQS